MTENCICCNVTHIKLLKSTIDVELIFIWEISERERYNEATFRKLMAEIFYLHNFNFYLILNIYAIYIVYVSPTDKRLKHVLFFRTLCIEDVSIYCILLLMYILVLFEFT